MNPSTPITPTTRPKPSGKLIETILFMRRYVVSSILIKCKNSV
nr:MAG TPA: hypothetical protein [Caudoviricetes sp.]